MARRESPSPLKGCFSSLATRTQAVVAKSGHTKLQLMERATEDGRKKDMEYCGAQVIFCLTGEITFSSSNVPLSYNM